MPYATPFSCYIMGEGSLPIQCADMLIAQGHTIHGVISTDPAIRRWADERRIPHTQPRADVREFMGQQPFDYLFSIVNPVILPAEILTLPRTAAINYHDAPLPKYAGSFATFWALINRETAHGITWHAMSVQVDAGDILKQRMVEIAPRETTLTLNTKCYEAAIQAFAELIDDLAADRMLPIRQDLAERSFFAQAKRPPMGGVISWQQSAEAIGAFARALDFGPYPNVMGLPKLAIGSELLIIAELDELDTCSTAAPGTISRLDGEVFHVATTTTDIALRKLLTVDGQDLSLTEVMATFGLRQGDQLPVLLQERADRLTALHAAIGRHEAFWAERLAAIQPFVLPFVERHAPGVAVKPTVIPMSIPDSVRSYLARSQKDFCSFLRAAFVAYLARIGRIDQFDLGFSSAALRGELGDLDCLFASTLPLRVEVTPNASYTDLAHALDAQAAAVAQRKTYARDITLRYPLLRTLPERRRGAALPVGVVEVADCTDTQAPADLILAITAADATCAWVYNPAALDPQTVERMTGHFQMLLEHLVADPEQPIDNLPLLPKAERQTLLVDWNATTQPYPTTGGVHDLVATQAARTPDALAVLAGDESLTYTMLNTRANQLAHYLRREIGCRDSAHEPRIGIAMVPGIEMIVGLLAIWKAGGAYVPLDPAYPVDRLQFMLQDSQVALILTQQRQLERLPPAAVPILCLDRDWSQIAVYPGVDPGVSVSPDQLAYLIYTSGSTGTPKGVLVPHRGVLNNVTWRQQTWPLSAADRALLNYSISFDPALWNMFWPLSAGACVVLVRAEVRYDSAALVRTIAEQRITVFGGSPSQHAVLLDEPGINDGTSLRYVVSGGEQLSAELQQRFFSRLGAILCNCYGPTEGTIDTTFWVCPRVDEPQAAPIGRPLPNVQVYVLDAQLQPVPIGVAGELYVGGVGLARGYHNRPDRTAEKFVPNPFTQRVPDPEGTPPGARLYRTGDLARYRADGNIEFLGRIDQQVKLRGFRIELGEIEAVLKQHPAAREAVVMVHANQSGRQQLIGYVVKSHAASSDQALRSDLYAFLQTRLPDFMLPMAILVLDALPLTPNGKLDRTALSKLNWVEASRRTPFVAPRSPLEEALVSIWQDSCQFSPIGVEDNFFDLSGNSLTATQVLSRVRRAFHVHLTVRDIFAAPTVAALACQLRAHERQPGHMDRVAVALMRLWSIPPEERQGVLQQKKTK